MTISYDALKKDLADYLIAVGNLITCSNRLNLTSNSHSTVDASRNPSGNRLAGFVQPLETDKDNHDLRHSLEMIEPGKELKTNCRQLLIAFSGGPDSTALLIALQELASSFNFALQACHINHGLRGNEANADAEFCRQLCNKLGIGCKVVPLNLTQAEANKQNRFSEEKLRQNRYQYLQDFAATEGIDFIVAGHTLDDQAETILFRLFRGTGLTGLAGIKACRPLTENIYLLRPLLSVTKEQCRQFLINRGIEACEDSSNLDEIYSRNYIRHNIMPAVCGRFPDFAAHLDSMRQIIAAEDDLLAKLGQQLFHKLESIDTNNWPLEILTSEPLSLQRRLIAYALQKRNIEASFAFVENILAMREGDVLNLSKHWRVRYSQNRLRWEEIRSKTKNNEYNSLKPVIVKIPGVNPVKSIGMTLLVEPYHNGFGHNSKLAASMGARQTWADSHPPIQCEEAKYIEHGLSNHPDRSMASTHFPFSFPEEESGQALVDLSKVKQPLVLRLRQSGDVIMPLGMRQSVKLKKYLHTRKKSKIDNSLSYAEVLLADQDEVLWLPGIGLSEKIKVKDIPSHKLVWLKMQELDGKMS